MRHSQRRQGCHPLEDAGRQSGEEVVVKPPDSPPIRRQRFDTYSEQLDECRVQRCLQVHTARRATRMRSARGLAPFMPTCSCNADASATMCSSSRGALAVQRRYSGGECCPRKAPSRMRISVNYRSTKGQHGVPSYHGMYFLNGDKSREVSSREILKSITSPQTAFNVASSGVRAILCKQAESLLTILPMTPYPRIFRPEASRDCWQSALWLTKQSRILARGKNQATVGEVAHCTGASTVDNSMIRTTCRRPGLVV